MSKTFFLFSAQYLPHMGGVERYSASLARELTNQGHRVLIIACNPGGLPAYERVEGIPVLRLPSYPLLEGRFPIPRPNPEFLRLHRKLKGLSPDLVLVQTRFYFHSLYGILFGRGHRAKTLVLDHGSSHLTVHHPLFDRLGAAFEHGLTALEKRFHLDFYGVSRASVKWLSHFGIQAAGILPNAVELSAIDERLANPQVDFRAKYQIPREAIVLVYTGRLLKEKGLLPLTEAFLSLCKTREDLYLVLAGDGPLEEELRKSASPRLILTGRLEAGEVTDLLGQSDIFCLPSRSEGFSTSLLEAAACGCYVVVTRSACPFELFQDETMASFLKDDSPLEIRKALEEILTDSARRRQAAAKARQALEAHFTWERTAEALISIAEGIQEP